MAKSCANYQGELLNEMRKGSIPVTIFLANGFQLKGIISAFDNYIILLESEGKQQMIFKHAISTIIPSKFIKLNFNQIPASDVDEDE